MEKLEPNIRCSKCKRILPGGGTKYIVKIDITADFDGILPEYEEEELDKTYKEVLDLDAAKLSADVHQEIIFLICKVCKDAFVNTVLKNFVQPGFGSKIN